MCIRDRAARRSCAPPGMVHMLIMSMTISAIVLAWRFARCRSSPIAFFCCSLTGCQCVLRRLQPLPADWRERLALLAMVESEKIGNATQHCLLDIFAMAALCIALRRVGNTEETVVAN